jgi:peptidoglycan/LPS O-acetylase OafA/YrhL
MPDKGNTFLYTEKVATPERVYSLDALRAVMMLLGILIHAGEVYSMH